MSSSLTVVYPSAVVIDHLISLEGGFTGVTTDIPHGYGVGMYVTIFIPYKNGTWNRINGQTFIITAVSEINPNNFIIVLDSSEFGDWENPPEVTVYPPPPANPFQVFQQDAQCVPAGEIATTLAFATNVIGPNNPP